MAVLRLICCADALAPDGAKDERGVGDCLADHAETDNGI
jgi:hypothetical protein